MNTMTERRAVRSGAPPSTLSPLPPPPQTAVPVSTVVPIVLSDAWHRIMTCPPGCGCRGLVQPLNGGES